MKRTLQTYLVTFSAGLTALVWPGSALVAQSGTPSTPRAAAAVSPAPSDSAEDAKGQLREAFRIASAAKTVDDFTQALRLCHQAQQTQLTPDHAGYVKRLAAWIYNKRGEKLVSLADEIVEQDGDRAVKYEQAALRDFESSVKLDATRWQSRHNRAVSSAIVGEFEQAATDFTFVLEQQPQHPNARYNRAEVYYQLQQYQKAVLDYDAVLRADPQDAAAYSGRGWSRFHLQQYDDALLDLNTVVRLRSDDATAYADRADVYAYLGQWERAAGDYRVAIRLDNQLGRAYRNVAWLMATCPEQRFRNPTLALRAAERAIELDGPSSRSLDTLAAAQASAGKFTEAVSTLEKALETASNGEVAGLQQRRALYESDQPYLEDAGTARLASAQE